MAIRALVTADWHIGKRLHQEDLSEDMQLFFFWLLERITTQIVARKLQEGESNLLLKVLDKTRSLKIAG